MPRYIVDLTELSSSSFASGDFVEVWHAAGGSNRSKKLRLDRFAMLAGAAFTGAVSVTGVATGNLAVEMTSQDLSNGTGPFLAAGRNSNGSTPAPGGIRFARANGGAVAFLYIDNSDIFRFLSGGAGAGPTSANFTSGAVVGAQTSSLDKKDVLGDPDLDGLWKRINIGAAAVRRFVYKRHDWVDEDTGAIVEGERPFGGEEFSGIIVDWAPHYGMDRDADHPAGKALNEINLLGDLLLAVADLHAEVDALRGSRA